MSVDSVDDDTGTAKPSRRYALPMKWALILAAISVGCAHQTRADGERVAAAKPTLVVGTVHCGRDGAVPVGKLVVSRTSRSVAIAQLVQGYANVVNLQATVPSPNMAEACAITHASLGLGWRKKVLEVRSHADLAKQIGAQSILITAVSSEEKCTNDGASVAGSYVEFGTTQCYESAVKAAAVLVDVEGKVLWRRSSFSQQASPSDQPPSVDVTVRRLFRDIPITEVIG